MTWFASPDDAAQRLGEAGYLTDAATATTAYLAGALEKPLLVEGPAGVGKSELAKAVSRATGAELVRLQCYEWNYKKQLLYIQAAAVTSTPTSGPLASGGHLDDSIFTEEFLLTRPLLTAIRRDEPTVLLVNEVDKADVEATPPPRRTAPWCRWSSAATSPSSGRSCTTWSRGWLQSYVLVARATSSYDVPRRLRSSGGSWPNGPSRGCRCVRSCCGARTAARRAPPRQ